MVRIDEQPVRLVASSPEPVADPFVEPLRSLEDPLLETSQSQWSTQLLCCTRSRIRYRAERLGASREEIQKLRRGMGILPYH